MQMISRYVLGAAALAASAACSRPPPAPVPAPAPAPSAVERGAYLAMLGGCNDCHTPKVFGPNGPELDRSHLLAGHLADARLPATPAGVIGPGLWGALATPDLTAWSGPWGVSYAANLTPDVTGLAGWTAEVFMQAMRTGKHAGVGRPILPPMPWASYARMNDADLRALFAYLQSLPPVTNQVPAPGVPASG